MEANDLNNIGGYFNEAKHSILKFIELYRDQSNNYHKIRVVSSDEDLSTNEDYFMHIPKEYEERYINALSAGLKAKEAYELLKETFEFEKIIHE
ncbi:hypothetical protein [Chryseobacterium balustinum]|uniref:hypothetical protein n=1 Tax=Chryseobacterium balustinum TaxID=246 RepID=UPI003CE84742